MKSGISSRISSHVGSRLEQRIDYASVAPETYRAMLGLSALVNRCALEEALKHLVLLRASQINGCAFCIDMHWKDARAAGEGEQRLYGLSAWREAPYYSERERAALEWTEAVTLVAEDHVPDGVHDAVRPHFSERELTDLTWLVATINAWNRMAIALRKVPGSHKPGERANAHPDSAR
ncbi:carboxymuconolactone decarboxylase family protein [Sorangium sp. So ce315]|uniref:carboxymuconolactone decarboxylase family protein n=1 Tax=Sorangium sp. So ce315 TaxID=3133299 RepID=UPI003F63E5CA